MAGVARHRWARTHRGLLQGFPHSPSHLNAPIAWWDATIVKTGCSTTLYLDDHTIGAAGPTTPEVLAQGCMASDRLDTIMGWTTNKSKCAVLVSCNMCDDHLQAIRQSGYKTVCDGVVILGLRYSHQTQTLYAKDVMSKVYKRLRLIAAAGITVREKTTLVTSLAILVYRWALAFVALTTAQLQDLRQATLAAILGRAKRGAATLLLLAVQGWRVDPKFLTHPSA